MCLALASLTLVGCVDEAVRNGTIVYTFSAWVTWTVFAVSVGITFVGFLIRSRSAGWGWSLMVAGALFFFLVGMGLSQDNVTVNDEKFTLRTGFWFAPTLREVRFADVSKIELNKTEQRKSTSYDIDCYLKTGGSTRVPAGDMMRAGPANTIVKMAKELGIPVYNYW